VKEHVKEAIAKLGENIQVRRFVRFNRGEGLQKKSVDFAAEVAAQTAAKADAKPAAEAPKVMECIKFDIKGEADKAASAQGGLGFGVTKPCRYLPPSRPPPPPPPLARQQDDGERHRSSQRSGGPGTPKHVGSLRSQFLEGGKQQGVGSVSSLGDLVRAVKWVNSKGGLL
jgi:hypothetical protein